VCGDNRQTARHRLRQKHEASRMQFGICGKVQSIWISILHSVSRQVWGTNLPPLRTTAHNGMLHHPSPSCFSPGWFHPPGQSHDDSGRAHGQQPGRKESTGFLRTKGLGRHFLRRTRAAEQSADESTDPVHEDQSEECPEPVPALGCTHSRRVYGRWSLCALGRAWCSPSRYLPR